MRILAGVGAWLLGAGTATAGSLLAVSLLGQGIADSPGQQLTTAAVKSALAAEAQEASPTGAQSTPPPAPTSSVTQPAASRPAVIQPSPATLSATPASPTVASPSPQGADSTVLTSPGGTVLAECRAAGAYLVSWSPTQGYEATSVIRGPAATARVIFESAANSVTMTVSCPNGTNAAPAATSYTHPYGDGTDE
jgi:hypothetical protein